MLFLCLLPSGSSAQQLSWSKTLATMSELRVNGLELLCDTTESWALATLTPKQMEENDSLMFSLLQPLADVVVSINGLEMSDSATVVIPHCPDLEISIMGSDSLTRNIRLDLTSLPIVSLHGEEFGRDYAQGAFQLISASQQIPETPLRVRWRGGTSLQYPKKSFGLNFSDGEDKNDLAILGMRTDNKWMLDAMSGDPARMRNRVSFELWEDFSSPPYQKAWKAEARNAISGRFVELFINNRYAGLYCLSEKMDRKQLKLRKCSQQTLHGVLYKAIQHNSFTECPEDFSDASTVWNNWEASYPDPDKGEPFSWMPIYNFCQYMREADWKEMPQRVDTPVWADFFLYVELMLARDNRTKNQYLYFYDVGEDQGCVLGMAPWDMDATWGRGWQGDSQNPHERYYNNNQIHVALQQQSGNELYNAQRYRELRQTWFQGDSIKERFHRYFSIFEESGAARREAARWSDVKDGDSLTMPELDFAGEREFIDEWIDNRLASPDSLYGYNCNTIYQPTCLSTSSEGQMKEGRVYDIGGKLITSPNCRRIFIRNGKKFWPK